MMAYGAAPLKSTCFPGRAIGAGAVAATGFDAAVHAVGGDGGRVPRPADQTRDMVRLGLDVLHVGRVRPDVLGGDVAPPSRFDVTPRGPGQRLAPRRAAVPHDEGPVPAPDPTP